MANSAAGVTPAAAGILPATHWISGQIESDRNVAC
jgi:hypothetical protein